MPSTGTEPAGLLPSERRAALALASLYALRMLGLFLILPVFQLYADGLIGATPLLAGLAIGAYGLSQALLQIPFGLLSDRYGRKPVIIVGLLIFAAGSVLAASAEHILWVIAGRALQGAGAIAAALVALAADLSRDEQRTKVMAIIGVSIGLSFALALVLGPLLNARIGVPGIFWLTAVLALLGIAIVVLAVPQPTRRSAARDTLALPGQFHRVLHDGQLLRLDAGIFALHLVLTATFVALPLALRDSIGLSADDHWMLYLPVLALSLGFMVPGIILAERRGRPKPALLAAVVALIASELSLLQWHDSLLAVALALTVFFTSVNLLEALLPSLVSRLAPADAKGTALGVYSSSQFLGAFCGGVLGGWTHGVYGLGGAFAIAALVALLWLALAAGMRNPPRLSSRLLHIGRIGATEAAQVAAQLEQIPGVAEAVVIADEGIAYLKIDRHRVDLAALQAFAAAQH